MEARNYASVCRGLLVLINCLNEIIDASGERKSMIDDAKSSVLKAYQNAERFLPTKTINKRLKISGQKISRWKKENRCSISVTKRCLVSCPMQLSLAEQMRLRNYLFDPQYQTLPRNHIWAEARRNDLHISAPTFYKYSRAMDEKQILYEIAKNETISIRAEKVFQILHMDSTILRCENGERVYVHFIMDNYSRTILGAVASHSSKSIVVAENLKNVLDKYKLYNHPFELYCDDGPENHGFVKELLKDNRIRITKIVANYKEKTSNNMIEAWNKKFKYVVLRKFKIKSFEHLNELLPETITYANNLKLPSLKTLSPHEVLDGMKLEDLGMKIKVQEAKQLRLKQNRATDCKIVCPSEA